MTYRLTWTRYFRMSLLFLHIVWPVILMSQPVLIILCRRVRLMYINNCIFTPLETAHSTYKSKRSTQSQFNFLNIWKKYWLMNASQWIAWESSNDICQKPCFSSFRFFWRSIDKEWSSSLWVLMISSSRLLLEVGRMLWITLYALIKYQGDILVKVITIWNWRVNQLKSLLLGR